MRRLVEPRPTGRRFENHPTHPVLEIQRMAGNSSVSSLFASTYLTAAGPVQIKFDRDCSSSQSAPISVQRGGRTTKIAHTDDAKTTDNAWQLRNGSVTITGTKGGIDSFLTNDGSQINVFTANRWGFCVDVQPLGSKARHAAKAAGGFGLSFLTSWLGEAAEVEGSPIAGAKAGVQGVNDLLYAPYIVMVSAKKSAPGKSYNDGETLSHCARYVRNCIKDLEGR
jgi:hypothetical protein